MSYLIKRIIALTILGCYLTHVHAQPAAASKNNKETFQVSNNVKQYSKVKCLMLCLGDHELIEHVAKIVKFDLEFTDQLEVELKRSEHEIEPKILQKLFDQGTSLCLYVRSAGKFKKNGSVNVEVQLRDPISNDLLFDKKVECSEKDLVFQSHSISDGLMPILTGQKGPCLSTLAYCKQLSSKHKVVCLADYACKQEKIVVAARTINVAPCWHAKASMLFYSQFTNINSRLMSLDLSAKKHKTICSYDGLNMQPSFSPDGIRSVLCLSGGGNSELYLYDQAVCNKLKRRVFAQLTYNKGNNVSPCLLPSGDVIFCSDFQTNQPQIYYLDYKAKKTRRLSNGKGYCAAPCYNQAKNSIVYTRYVQGVFQLFTINLGDKKPMERQLTFGQGDKVEPTWSECGNYVAFTYGCPELAPKKTEKRLAKKGKKSLDYQIAVLNCTSGAVRVLTSGPEPKSFPAWTSSAFYQT